MTEAANRGRTYGFRAPLTTIPPNILPQTAQCSIEIMSPGVACRGGRGMYVLVACRKIVSVLSGRRRYRPELHYMRGPGPKWIERHGRLSVQARHRLGRSHSDRSPAMS